MVDLTSLTNINRAVANACTSQGMDVLPQVERADGADERDHRLPGEHGEVRRRQPYAVVVDHAADVPLDPGVPYAVVYAVPPEDLAYLVHDGRVLREEVLEVVARHLYLALDGDDALLDLDEPHVHLPRLLELEVEAVPDLRGLFVLELYLCEPLVLEYAHQLVDAASDDDVQVLHACPGVDPYALGPPAGQRYRPRVRGMVLDHAAPDAAPHLYGQR